MRYIPSSGKKSLATLLQMITAKTGKGLNLLPVSIVNCFYRSATLLQFDVFRAYRLW
jgi:hypothetical protein